MLHPNIINVRDQLHNIATDPATPPEVAAWATQARDTLNAADEPEVGYRKGDPLPNSLGAAADHYADVRERRLAKQKETDAVKERETEISKLMLSALQDSPDTGASGKHHRVQLVKKTVQNVTDWAAFHQWIAQNNAFEMLQRRMSDKAVKDWQDENGKLPPGVAESEIDTLSFMKI